VVQDAGGEGGAGGLVYGTGLILNGDCTIQVGIGGLSDVDTTGNGWDSSITINGITIMGKGGGGGCDGVGNGYDGGSGGGGASSSGNEDGGISTQETS